MHSMNDERFFDLAMKAIARQCTDAERAELDALLARQPELKAEFERLQAEVRVAKEALPLVNATEAVAGELPAYARGRLQTKVRQTLGRPPAVETTQRDRERSAMWTWRWALGLAAATAAVVLVVMPMFRGTPQPIIQVAMLDVAGPSRGGETNEVTLLQQSWPGTAVEKFSDAEALRTWQSNWPGSKGQPAAKVVYDRAAAEIRVLGQTPRGTFAKTFPLEPDLAMALKQAAEFIRAQMER
jgi:hypothetical protein